MAKIVYTNVNAQHMGNAAKLMDFVVVRLVIQAITVKKVHIKYKITLRLYSSSNENVLRISRLDKVYSSLMKTECIDLSLAFKME